VEKCGHLIGGDPDRPCVSYKGHKRKTHTDAIERERNPGRCREWHQRNREWSHEWRERNIKRHTLNNARTRARKRGTPFTLTLEDIPPIPERCPILGTDMRHSHGRGRPDSPSLDCFDPALGYVPGNIWWISNKANMMKSNADLATLRRFAQWVETLEDE
jgi:hypothetical protein